MQEGIFLKSYIYKCCIEARNKFFHFSQVQITHCKTGIRFFRMKFNQFFIFQQGYFNALWCSIYN